MRVCDICHGGSNIQSLSVHDNVTGAQFELKPNEDTWDCCADCRKLLFAKDWIGLATKSSAGQAEDLVKKGTSWLTDQIVPEVKKFFNQKTEPAKKEEPFASRSNPDAWKD